MRELVVSPWVLLPALGGASGLIVSWAVGGGPLGTVAGLAGILGGVGALATRWIFGTEAAAAKVHAELEAEQVRAKDRQLDDLAGRLLQDEDPRTEELLGELRRLYAQFQPQGRWSNGLSLHAASEIRSQVEKLFQGCIICLERSLDLYQSSKEMETRSGKKQAKEARKRVLEEVEASIEQLARTLDEVAALSLVGPDQEEHLARVRQELDQSLEVARRVEERMKSLEEDLGRSSVRSPEN